MSANRYRGGLPPEKLVALLDVCRRNGPDMSGPLPGDLQALIETYDALGKSVSTAEACLVSALDALDQQTGEGRVEDPEPFEILQAEAFDLLRQSGEMFARFDGAFASLVHQGGGWPNQPVDCDGVTLYRNTFKYKEQLNPAQRAQEYQDRVDTFLGGGASFDDIVLLTPDSLQSLKAWAHYDYVMLPNYEIRVYPTAPRGS